MNVLGKLFRKPDPKNKKTVKIKVKLPHVNKKSLARKRSYTVSHSTKKNVLSDVKKRQCPNTIQIL